MSTGKTEVSPTLNGNPIPRCPSACVMIQYQKENTPTFSAGGTLAHEHRLCRQGFGISARFGGDKLLTPLWGKPLISHVLDSLPPSFSRGGGGDPPGGRRRLGPGAGLEAIVHDLPLVSDSIRLGLAAMADMGGLRLLRGGPAGANPGQLSAPFWRPFPPSRTAFSAWPTGSGWAAP